MQKHFLKQRFDKQLLVMDSSYIYSAVRTRTLASMLVNEADVERLLGSSNRDELRSALLDSYLALYVNQSSDWNIDNILESHQLDAVRLLLQISPDPVIIYGLLSKYDFHNARVVAKSNIANFSYEQVVKNMSSLGRYSVEVFYEHASQGTLYRLGSELQKAYTDALSLLEAKEIDKAEFAIDACYWNYRRNHAEFVDDSFVRDLLAIEIDLYNAQVRLRSEVIESFDFSKLLQQGGSLSIDKFISIESTQNALSVYGGDIYWQEAFENLHSDGLGLASRLIRQYVCNYVHRASNDMFCTASLFNYLFSVENSADVIRTIVTGVESGLSESSIRSRIPSL